MKSRGVYSLFVLVFRVSITHAGKQFLSCHVVGDGLGHVHMSRDDAQQQIAL
jgi:hypothetical protein